MRAPPASGTPRSTETSRLSSDRLSSWWHRESGPMSSGRCTSTPTSSITARSITTSVRRSSTAPTLPRMSAGSSSSGRDRNGFWGSPRTSSPRDRQSTSPSGSGRAGKEELLHLLQQEFPGVRLPQVQGVVVDQLLLVLEPFRPAHRADLLEDPLAGRV